MLTYSHGHGATPTIGYISTSIVYSCGLRLVGTIRLLYSHSFESGRDYRIRASHGHRFLYSHGLRLVAVLRLPYVYPIGFPIELNIFACFGLTTTLEE